MISLYTFQFSELAQIEQTHNLVDRDGEKKEGDAGSFGKDLSSSNSRSASSLIEPLPDPNNCSEPCCLHTTDVISEFIANNLLL